MHPLSNCDIRSCRIRQSLHAFVCLCQCGSYCGAPLRTGCPPDLYSGLDQSMQLTGNEKWGAKTGERGFLDRGIASKLCALLQSYVGASSKREGLLGCKERRSIFIHTPAHSLRLWLCKGHGRWSYGYQPCSGASYWLSSHHWKDQQRSVAHDWIKTG